MKAASHISKQVNPYISLLTLYPYENYFEEPL